MTFQATPTNHMDFQWAAAHGFRVGFGWVTCCRITAWLSSDGGHWGKGSTHWCSPPWLVPSRHTTISFNHLKNKPFPLLAFVISSTSCYYIRNPQVSILGLSLLPEFSLRDEKRLAEEAYLSVLYLMPGHSDILKRDITSSVFFLSGAKCNS